MWWPVGTYWLSDDWLAIHYASDFGRAWRDFTADQYDLHGAVFFYRPLITLSFAIEYAIAGADPMVSHLTNAVAMGLSAMLLGQLTARFFRSAAGWWTGLVWGTLPLHAGSVLWAVGRVDSHAVPWILLTAVALIRWIDGERRTRLLALAAAAAALATKELAIVIPGIAAVLCFVLAPPGERLRRTASGAWPFFALVAGYFVLRLVFLGHFVGGYQAGSMVPGEVLSGFGSWIVQVATPTHALTEQGLRAFELPADLLRFWWLGALPAALGFGWLVVRRPGAAVTLALLFVGCALPCIQFWADAAHVHNIRYFTLASAAVAVAIGSGRAWLALPALALAALPHLEVRADYRAAFDRSRSIHERVAEAASQFPTGPVFVAGLPRQNASRTVVEFHVGVDRLLTPPFGEGHTIYALRPLSGDTNRLRIPYGNERGLPCGITLGLMNATGIALLPPANLASAKARIDGSPRLDSEALWAIHEGRADPSFVLDAPGTTHLRITTFTASGYVTSILPATLDDGSRVPLQAWLTGSTGLGTFTATDLRVPTAVDLSPRFPVLIEGGRLDETLAGPIFEPTHASSELLWVEFDRGYFEFSRPK